MLAQQATGQQRPPAKVVPISHSPRFRVGGDARMAGYKDLAAKLIGKTLTDLQRDPADCDEVELEDKADAYTFVADEDSALVQYVALLQLSPESEEALWHRLFEAQAAAETWYLRYRKVLPLQPALPAARA